LIAQPERGETIGAAVENNRAVPVCSGTRDGFLSCSDFCSVKGRREKAEARKGDLGGVPGRKTMVAASSRVIAAPKNEKPDFLGVVSTLLLGRRKGSGPFVWAPRGRKRSSRLRAYKKFEERKVWQK